MGGMRMQWLLLGGMGALVLRAAGRVRLYRCAGMPRAARRRYLAASWALGLTILAAMAVQEGALLFSGQLSWQNALPLHLCSLLGLLTLPTLLTQRPLLLNAAFFAGVPGAALALLFPAVLQTPWPRVTVLAFHTLHAGLVCAPLLPMGMGWRPQPWGALGAWCFLVTAAALATLANRITGGNYFFLAGPVAGTPLMWLAGRGALLYRLGLMALVTLALAAEGAGLWLLYRHMRVKT